MTSSFSGKERRLIDRLRTPSLVQRYLNALPYNTEPPPGRATLRSFRGVVRHHTAHCLEAALAAAVILEQHGYPPLVLSFESIDNLDHVLFVYQRRGRWGSVARSRDPGLHGRKPVFRTARDLALSYVDPYIDFTGRITGYAVVDLRDPRATTTGGSRSGTSGRSSVCCSTTRTGRSARRTNESIVSAAGTANTERVTDGSRSTIEAWKKWTELPGILGDSS